MSETEVQDAAVLSAAQDAHEKALNNEPLPEATAPVETGLEAPQTLPAKVVELDQTSTKVATETPQALPNAAQPNAASTVPSGHASVVNPKTGLSHNPFTWFHEHVISKLPTIFGFVADAAQKTEYVVKESQNSPTFAAAQSDVIAAAVALSSAASIAVSEKGLNPTQDINTAELLASLVSKVHTYLGILETEYQDAQTAAAAPVATE